MTDSKIKSAKKLLASGVPPRDVAGNLGVSIPTLYRWISSFESRLALFLTGTHLGVFAMLPSHLADHGVSQSFSYRLKDSISVGCPFTTLR